MPASANWPDSVMTTPILSVSWALAGAVLASRTAATPLMAMIENRIVILPEMSWRGRWLGLEHRRPHAAVNLACCHPLVWTRRHLFHPRLHRVFDVFVFVDFHVAQAIGGLVDPLDVDGENDVARLRVDLDRTARAFPLHAFGRRDQRVAIGLAAGLLQRLVDQVHAVVAADREDVRIEIGRVD